VIAHIRAVDFYLCVLFICTNIVMDVVADVIGWSQLESVGWLVVGWLVVRWMYFDKVAVERDFPLDAVVERSQWHLVLDGIRNPYE